MRTTRHRGLLVVAGFMLVTGLAACSPTPDAAEKTADLDSSSSEQNYDDWQLAFEKCMEDQGIDLSQFMSKAGGPGEDGDDASAPAAPSEADLAAMQEAQEICGEKLGDPPTRDDLPSDEERHEMTLRFAKCMREAGYEYPDPEPGASGSVAAMPEGDFDPADIDACSEEAGFTEGAG